MVVIIIKLKVAYRFSVADMLYKAIILSVLYVCETCSLTLREQGAEENIWT